jgi:Glycosyl transferase family 11
MLNQDDKTRRVIYPVLGARFDLWFLRLSGHGLGNSFYSYFHAVALAEQFDADIISPPWVSLKSGPLLRGDATKRSYLGMFGPYRGEIHGFRKLWMLLRGHGKRATIDVGDSRPVVLSDNINYVSNCSFTFKGLYPHRDAIRKRMLGILKDPLPQNHTWGRSGYIAVHVRLGDFAQISNPKLVSGNTHNLRIPLFWYENVVRALRNRYPDKPVLVFSDGKEEELKSLLDLGAKLYRSGSDMTDLLAMAAASILVGSNSTYSRWAAFLGNMPSIWVEKEVPAERPTDPETLLLYVPIDADNPTLWPDLP